MTCFLGRAVGVAGQTIAPYTLAHADNIRVAVVPVLLITSGALLIDELGYSKANWQFRENYGGSPHHLVGLDDIMQYAPIAGWAALTTGSFLTTQDGTPFSYRLTSAALSGAMLAAAVNGTKALGLSTRPNGANRKSFMSGHTAFAFWGAELFRLEYGEEHPYLASAMYGMAISVGMLRIVHQKHWVGDVIAGAGVGVGSALFGYFVAPYLVEACGGGYAASAQRKARQVLSWQLAPYSTENGGGVSVNLAF